MKNDDQAIIGNSELRWGIVAISFHWLFVLLVAVEVPVGLWMRNTYAARVQDASLEPRLKLLSQIHHTIGLLLLLLVLVRLSWRLMNAGPKLSRPVLRRIASASHFLLYFLLFAIPLSGWAAMSSYGGSPTYFGTLHVFRIVPQRGFIDPNGYMLFAAIHRWCLFIGGGLLALHISAAVWHQFLRRDGLLARMWF